MYISSKFAQKRKSCDNSKIEKGLKTTQKKTGSLWAYDHVSHVKHVICYDMLSCDVIV